MAMFKVYAIVSYVFLKDIISAGLKYVQPSENLQCTRNLGISCNINYVTFITDVTMSNINITEGISFKTS